MTRARAADTDPRPLSGAVCFEEGDFHALSAGLAKDPQYNDRRLATRRRLLTLGKEVVSEAAKAKTKLECRTSLHNPNTFNGMRVNRIWAYVTRAKAEKTKLKRVLGSDLGKDLDAAYSNAYLCLAIEAEALEVSLRIHPDGWYDGQNLKNKVERGDLRAWLAELNRLDGYLLRMDDWKGEWRCGELTVERLEEFLSYYTPGEHALTVVRRYPAPAGARGAAIEPAAAAELKSELLRLLPLYRFTAWSPENDHLFG